MKINNKSKEIEFEPFTMLVETKEEAQCIWHKLNNNNFGNYFDNNKDAEEILKNNNWELWDLLNEELIRQSIKPKGK